jgi:hypothetical protein
MISDRLRPPPRTGARSGLNVAGLLHFMTRSSLYAPVVNSRSRKPGYSMETPCLAWNLYLQQLQQGLAADMRGVGCLQSTGGRCSQCRDTPRVKPTRYCFREIRALSCALISTFRTQPWLLSRETRMGEWRTATRGFG